MALELMALRRKLPMRPDVRGSRRTRGADTP